MPPKRPRPVSAAVSTALLRLWFAAAGRLAPGIAQRHAAALILTPRRRRPRDPEIPGLVAREEVYRVAGHAIATWSWGTGPTVVLVHGWSGRAADMTTIAASLVRAGFRAMVVDLPAHGRSPGRRTSLAEWIRVLDALVERLGGRLCGVHAVVAHSFGAAALALALETGLVARGAVLLAPAQGPQLYLGRLRRHLGLGERHARGMERQLVRHVGRELSYFDASRAAASLAVPALLVHDPLDPEVPFAQAQSIAAAWPGSQLVSMPNVGHNGVLKAPASVDAVTRFVLGLVRARAVAS